MSSARDPAQRPVTEVLGAGVATGAIAGMAAGAIDAVWSWAPAAQFVPGVLGRVRFVLFAAASHALAGVVLGLVATIVLLVLARATRLGDLVRFGWREHLARRDRDPRDALAGLALAIALLPCLVLALYVAYKLVLPYVTARKELRLVVIVAIGGGLGAVLAAIPLAFVVGRLVEEALRAAAKHRRLAAALAWPYAPLAAAAVLVAIALVAWLATSWETARQLPLRGAIVAAVALVLAIPASRPARSIIHGLAMKPPLLRRATWAALPVAMLGFVLATGGRPAIIKAASAYTGLTGRIAHVIRNRFDWDHDGYSRFLGGGDCDDGERTVHPGAPEIPDDGIDQNCVGGDATTKRSLEDVAFGPVPSDLPKDFDVLVITIDTIRADHLGTYGYKRATSPNLDKLAREAAVFEHGWAHAPSTRYSMPALLTGRLPLDVYYDLSVSGWPGLALKATTLCEALGPLGFATGAITNYEYFERYRHMDQGCAEYDNENARLHQQTGGGPARTRGSSSRQQTDKGIAFLERHKARRWFLWIHYYDPHYEYELHPEVPQFGSDEIARYDNEIRFTDHHIGRLLDALRERGLYDKTVVVVTGDHGEGFGEHGVKFHGYHLYAPQTKVPLIVRVPGLPPRRSTLPAGHIDILPTLVNLAGGKPDPDMEGRSLVGAIAGSDSDRVVFQQLSYEGNHEMRAGVSRNCHVIYNVSPDTSWEVYRIDRDPQEREDLAGDEDECEDTRRAVERWYDSEQVPAGAAAALLPGRPPIAAPLDIALGDDVRLLAVEAPKTAKPGETVTFLWTFEARGTPAPGWKMFVHVEAPGHVLVNGDHQPARPFEWWKKGQYIRYATTLALPRTPQKATYTVWAGMFKGTTRARAAAPRHRVDKDAVAVATVEVAP